MVLLDNNHLMAPLPKYAIIDIPHLRDMFAYIFSSSVVQY